ncbi:MAG: ribosomal RNA small subunit methyltransferase A [Kiritimatiellae bacterium]|nr:ribosomal RNA small subunit methyltransferase A [Kiritimatiellia bacterium]
MKLTSPSRVGKILKELDFRPSRALGQNFLIDENILRIMIGLAAPSPDDVVFEIGPGLGVLTESLLEQAGRVIAVEKDARLCRYLRSRFGEVSKFELIEADALDLDLVRLAAGATKMVSNLPYAAGSRILMELFAAPRPVPEMLVTVQRDVAYRLAASPATKEYGLLSICAQVPYEVEVRKEISPTCFMPRPQVWSAIVTMRQRARPLVELEDAEFFRRLVKWAFSHRRKQLGSLLHHPPAFARALPWHADRALAELGVDPRARAETLSVEQWGALANALARRQ